MEQKNAHVFATVHDYEATSNESLFSFNGPLILNHCRCICTLLD